MKIDTKSRHLTPAGGNVFADLGFEPEQAAALQAESKRIISEKLAIKKRLMGEVSGACAGSYELIAATQG